MFCGTVKKPCSFKKADGFLISVAKLIFLSVQAGCFQAD